MSFSLVLFRYGEAESQRWRCREPCRPEAGAPSPAPGVSTMPPVPHPALLGAPQTRPLREDEA